jgi:hypothetical protein
MMGIIKNLLKKKSLKKTTLALTVLGTGILLGATNKKRSTVNNNDANNNDANNIDAISEDISLLLSKLDIVDIIDTLYHSIHEKNGNKTVQLLSNIKKNFEPIDAIVAELDKDDLMDKINTAWNEKKMLIVVISDKIVLNGDYFEVHPLNFATKREFIIKIEENSIMHTRLFNRSNGIINILNNGQLIPMKYRNSNEAIALSNLENGTTLL